MNFFLIYLFSFMLSYFGFFLGKTTLEEHKEIKKTVSKLLEKLMFLFYLILTILFYKSLNIIIIILIILGYYIFSLKHKKVFFLEFHEILIYSISIILLKNFFEIYLYLSLIPISYILFKNSFKNFNSKEEIYKLIILIILFIFFKIII